MHMGINRDDNVQHQLDHDHQHGLQQGDEHELDHDPVHVRFMFRTHLGHVDVGHGGGGAGGRGRFAVLGQVQGRDGRLQQVGRLVRLVLGGGLAGVARRVRGLVLALLALLLVLFLVLLFFLFFFLLLLLFRTALVAGAALVAGVGRLHLLLVRLALLVLARTL